MTQCWYPVHAFGYNWLKDSGESAELLAERIDQLITDYQKKKFNCQKVIIVTHSMGGLVARALCHPDYGNIQDKILGIVHGVMPAMGAAAAYRRMRAGFEGGGIADWVIGNTGPEVTAVMANAPGGLQLLPSQAYGKHWLKFVTRGGTEIDSLPKKGDPYAEIYQRSDVWWGLLREEWINPARDKRAGLEQTTEYLDTAKGFHEKINSTYHQPSYALYSGDPNRLSFRNVVWEVPDTLRADKLDALQIVAENSQDAIELSAKADVPKSPHRMTTQNERYNARVFRIRTDEDLATESRQRRGAVLAKIRPPAEPGDQTVPLHSAEHQLQSGKFAGVFQQTGNEHQDCYKDRNAQAAALYSIIQIAKTMVWTKS